MKSRSFMISLLLFVFSMSIKAAPLPEKFRRPLTPPVFTEQQITCISARQSSLGNTFGPAKNAIDGNTDGTWRGANGNSITHTLQEANPWLEVDLGAIHRISRIEIWNRMDNCCVNRLTNLNFLVKEKITDAGEKVLAQNRIHQASDPASLSFTTSKTGRYVRVQLFGNSQILSVAEIKVFGTPNLAEGQPATQSTTGSGGVASRAVDGNTDGFFFRSSVTHTNGDNNPWWEVDLGSDYDITKVEIWNRTDCCETRLKNMKILVKSSASDAGQVFSQNYSFKSGQTSPIAFFGKKHGRIVRIQLEAREFLSLAEVKVYAASKAGTLSQTNAFGSVNHYISQQLTPSPKEFSFGASWYVGVFPLITNPLENFQVGLPSTWVMPDNIDVSIADFCPGTSKAQELWPGQDHKFLFQTMEGGLGYWTGTQFGTANPKFKINGTPACYDSEISSTGWGFESPDGLPCSQLGIAQLSNQILLPPDGLTFSSNTNGELLGTAWMALPLTNRQGYFQLQTSKMKEQNKMLTAGNSNTPAIAVVNSSSDLQLFTIEMFSDGYFNLKNKGNNKNLEGNAEGPSNFLAGAAFTKEGSATGQKWKLFPAGNGKYLLKNQFRGNNQCLEWDEASGKFFMRNCSTSSNQQWELNGVIADNKVPTGNFNWTLFFNAANFKGPIAFYIPQNWSEIVKQHSPVLGLTLDTKAAAMGGGAMEFNARERMGFATRGSDGKDYMRIAKLQFPVNANGKTPLMQDIKKYSSAAMFDPVLSAFSNNENLNTTFLSTAAVNPTVNADPLVWQTGNTSYQINQVVETDAGGGRSFGLKWKKPGAEGQFPEYFKKEGNTWTPVDFSELPNDAAILADQVFTPKAQGSAFTSDPAVSCYATPGPVAGPFTKTLVDGSTVTYSWYRFVDQPAIQRMNLTATEKALLQAKIEKIHREWTNTKNYMPAPSSGTLVTFDTNLMVQPPTGFEFGFVPIVTRQDK